MPGTIPPSLEYPAIAELALHKQWVCWQSTPVPGKKPTKIPVNPKRPSSKASTINNFTWDTFTSAVQAWQNSATLTGVGFVFTKPDEYVGADFDQCVVAGKIIDERVERWVKELDSYTEYSPSGTGLHVVFKGKLPNGGLVQNRKGPVEFYAERRYFTVSGDHVKGTPEDIRDASDAFQKIYDEVFGGDLLVPSRPAVGHAEGGAAQPSPTVPAVSAVPGHTGMAAPALTKLAQLMAEVAPHLSADAEAPMDKIEAMFTNVPEVADIWNRKPLTAKQKTWSQSEWDQSLTDRLVKSGMEVPEVARTIIAYRRHHREDVNKALRPDYIARTIRNVLEELDDESINDAVDAIGDVDMGAIPKGAPIPEETRNVIVDGLSKALKVPIVKVIEWPSEPRHEYEIITTKGKVKGDIGMLSSQQRFRDSIMEAAGVVIPRFNLKAHDKIVQRLLDIREQGVITDEATAGGQHAAWLEQFIQHCPKPGDTLTYETLESGFPFIHQGELYIQSISFFEWVRKFRGVRITQRELSYGLVQVGCEKMQKRFDFEDGHGANRRVYRLPNYFLTVAERMKD